MFSTGRKIKTEASESESALAKSWRALLGFFVKTLIPLIPIAGFIYGFSLFVNAEISGHYTGVADSIGAVSLDLNEDQEALSGTVMLGQKRFKITDGKMLSDYKMQLQILEESRRSRSKLDTSAPSGTNFKQANDNLSIESLKNTETSTGKVALQGQIAAQKEGQNHLSGQISLENQVFSFNADRNSFASFAGQRWLRRLLKTVGIK